MVADEGLRMRESIYPPTENVCCVYDPGVLRIIFICLLTSEGEISDSITPAFPPERNPLKSSLLVQIENPLNYQVTVYDLDYFSHRFGKNRQVV